MRWSRDTSSSPTDRTVLPWQEVRDLYDGQAWRYDLLYADKKSRVRLALLERPVLRMVRRARRVLELGCGTGRLLRTLPGREVIGVDISARSLSFAREKGCAVVAADAHRLPFPEGAFDAVVAANGVFTHLDYEPAFTEISRVLAPGGQVAVHQFAAHTWHIRRVPRPAVAAWHLRSIEELDRPAARCGLTPGERHYYRTFRFPPYLVPIPSWMHGSLWSHVFAIYRKPGVAT